MASTSLVAIPHLLYTDKWQKKTVSLNIVSYYSFHKLNRGNTKSGVSPRLKIWTADLDLWPWKSIRFQILLRTKYVLSLVKIHLRMLILECSQGCYGRMDGSVTISLRNFVGEGITRATQSVAYPLAYKIWPGDIDLWPWKPIGFQIFLRTKYVPSLVKIHWRMLILECLQGCYGRTDGRKEERTVALLYPFTTSLERG